MDVVFHGTVQGVGFRYTTRRVAAGFHVCGTVKNLRDGTVELRAEGDREELERFLAGISEAMPGYIHKTDVQWGKGPARFEGFDIAF
jgi:acylphosphatase